MLKPTLSKELDDPEVQAKAKAALERRRDLSN
jgi:hypothetical protein